MKRIALTLWNNRIAPVFDVAQHLLIVNIDNGVIMNVTERRLLRGNPQQRALRLSSLRVKHLVCGAITRTAAESLQQRGIEVVSFISGESEHVLQALLDDNLCDGHLAMPGCAANVHHRRRQAPAAAEPQQTDTPNGKGERCHAEPKRTGPGRSRAKNRPQTGSLRLRQKE